MQLLAHQAQQVYRVRLDDEKVTCNSRNLLAFESGIDWDIRRVHHGLAGKWPAASSTPI